MSNSNKDFIEIGNWVLDKSRNGVVEITALGGKPIVRELVSWPDRIAPENPDAYEVNIDDLVAFKADDLQRGEAGTAYKNGKSFQFHVCAGHYHDEDGNRFDADRLKGCDITLLEINGKRTIQTDNDLVKNLIAATQNDGKIDFVKEKEHLIKIASDMCEAIEKQWPEKSELEAMEILAITIGGVISGFFDDSPTKRAAICAILERILLDFEERGETGIVDTFIRGIQAKRNPEFMEAIKSLLGS